MGRRNSPTEARSQPRPTASKRRRCRFDWQSNPGSLGCRSKLRGARLSGALFLQRPAAGRRPAFSPGLLAHLPVGNGPAAGFVHRFFEGRIMGHAGRALNDWAASEADRLDRVAEGPFSAVKQTILRRENRFSPDFASAARVCAFAATPCTRVLRLCRRVAMPNLGMDRCLPRAAPSQRTIRNRRRQRPVRCSTR